ncbi:unnamed protein product [Rotaria sordida]|uniref:Uncharacterized protein n=1 Tax=Rotaria sordida TaxID=392033 RepID=A0A819YRH4_9BILA|nr:unnamed protein product [Rotaria sordida]CAF4153308.1 unnamed protein product [Rotaria sordida]
MDNESSDSHISISSIEEDERELLATRTNAQFSTDCVSFWFTYQRVFRSFNTIRARRATLYVYDGINQTIIERIPIAYCKQMGYQKLFLSNFIMNCYQVVIK